LMISEIRGSSSTTRRRMRLPLWKADLPLLLQIHAKFKAVLSRNGNASAGGGCGRSSAMKPPQNLLDNLPCDGDLGHHRAETQCVIRWECGLKRPLAHAAKWGRARLDKLSSRRSNVAFPLLRSQCAGRGSDLDHFPWHLDALLPSIALECMTSNGRPSPFTLLRVARAASSHPHLASVLQQGRKSVNICVSLGVIRGIPGKGRRAKSTIS
jgi:hypothetical protein